MKYCPGCEKQKGKEEFGFNIRNKDGLASYCRLCKSDLDKKAYSVNSDKKKAAVRALRLQDPKLNRERAAAYYLANKDWCDKASADYYLAHKTEIAERRRAKRDETFYRKAYLRNKRRGSQDPAFRAVANARSRVAHFMQGKAKFSKSLDCSLELFRTYISAQFKEGMNWGNYGEWEIDHKHPLSVAYLEGPEAFKKACHYTNLQPLWAEENLAKGNKIDVI